ncbi:predicted protein [Culex quinquefasciatus]|uniref:Predicted protein n=1 Tax=Culex quinquefasciatus TaxID=7176 RepID=B0XB61_CULQU|nr:predicted protein [Culex quinquefasciatus]|eukprot:XP_001866883.1 predicted protein [Culex quinquefasciatus]
MQRRSAARKANSQQATLPDEIWELIFDYLYARNLRWVRLVSREWNNLVRNSPKLLGKLTLSIPAVCTTQQLQQTATTRYRNITVRNATADTAPKLKLFKVRKLVIKQPWITAAAVVRMVSGLPIVDLKPDLHRETVAMLRCAAMTDVKKFRSKYADFPASIYNGLRWLLPGFSLVVAKYFNYELFDSVPTGQMLTCLESLHLDLGDKDEFLCVFQNMCPNLKRLKLKAVMKRYLGQDYGAKLLEFIRTTRHTLKELVFDGIDFCDESLLRDIIAVEGLELELLTLSTCEARDYDIMDLRESQTLIDTLNLPYSCIICNNILTGIVMYLQYLTTLYVTVDFVDLVPILSNMAHLESLSLMYDGNAPDETLDLSGYGSTQLRTLVLIGFSLDSTALLTCFAKCPNIRKLWIKLCPKISVHDILVIAGRLEKLYDLAVKRHSDASCPENFGEYSLSPFRKLRLLNVIRETSCKRVCNLLENCPVLYSLILSSSIFTDIELALMIKYMGNVTALCLTNLPNMTIKH